MYYRTLNLALSYSFHFFQGNNLVKKINQRYVNTAIKKKKVEEIINMLRCISGYFPQENMTIKFKKEKIKVNSLIFILCSEILIAEL